MGVMKAREQADLDHGDDGERKGNGNEHETQENGTELAIALGERQTKSVGEEGNGPAEQGPGSGGNCADQAGGAHEEKETGPKRPEADSVLFRPDEMETEGDEQGSAEPEAFSAHAVEAF